MIGKIWDAITDPPITGYLSDRTHTRFGRRRPYMVVGGAIISFFCMGGLIFTPVELSSQMKLFIYVTFLYCLLNTAYTLVNIPYAALLPELTEDYHERTILTGYRMSFAVLGTFVGGAALVMPIVNLFPEVPPRGWSMMGTFMGAVMLVSTMATVFAIHEPKTAIAHEQTGFIPTFTGVLKDRVFLSALLPWTFFITGTSMIQGALVYYFTYIFGNEGLFQLALIALLSFSLLCIPPLWVRIAHRIGKKQCYMIGMGIMSAVSWHSACLANTSAQSSVLSSWEQRVSDSPHITLCPPMQFFLTWLNMIRSNTRAEDGKESSQVFGPSPAR